MSEARATWNQAQFDSIMAEYLQHSKRDAVTAVNTKLFYISRAATRMTKKAGKLEIESGLLKMVTPHRPMDSVYHSASSVPLGVLIIMGRMKHEGELEPREMAAAVKSLIAARKRSNAFLASGWIDSIKALEPLADRVGRKPQMAPESEMKRYGKAKGDTAPAVEGPNIVGKIVNKAMAKRDKKDALGRYGSVGLAQAFESEANSMLDYIDNKMQKAAREANRRL